MQYILCFIFDLFLFQDCIIRIIPQMRFYEEIITIILLICTFINVCISKKIYKKENLILSLCYEEKKSLKAFIGLLFIGFISTIFYHIQPSTIGILKDFFAFQKFFMCYLCCVILFRNINKEQLLRKVCKRARIYITIAFIFGILNIFFDFGVSHDVRCGFRSYKFIYTHPTYLVFAMVVLVCVLTANGRKKDKLYILEAMSILVLTFRSKAIVFVLAYVLINFFIKHMKYIKIKYIFILIVLGVLITYKKIALYFSYGLYAARPALHVIGAKLMVDYFPLGTGFCTFASVLSGKYYSPLYQKYGINEVSGLTIFDYSYMSDTYWPYIYSQFGIIGLVLFVLILWNIYKAFKNKYGYSKNKLKAINLLLFYLLFASIAEAIFIDVTGQFAFIVFAVFLGNYTYKNNIPKEGNEEN